MQSRHRTICSIKSSGQHSGLRARYQQPRQRRDGGNVVVVTRDQVATVDDQHVNLGTVVTLLLASATLAAVEAAPRKRAKPTPGPQVAWRARKPSRIDCDGGKLILLCLGAKFLCPQRCVLLQVCGR